MTKIFDLVYHAGDTNAVDFSAKRKLGLIIRIVGGEIVATTDPSLGLPLLPPYEKGDQLKQFREECNIAYSQSRNPISDEIYKYVVDELDKILAIPAKKYTEEDLKKALVMKNMGYGEKHIINSLNPKPIQVEIEINLVGKCKGVDFEKCMEFDPHDPCTACDELEELVTENGYVKVKRWIYENETNTVRTN